MEAFVDEGSREEVSWKHGRGTPIAGYRRVEEEGSRRKVRKGFENERVVPERAITLFLFRILMTLYEKQCSPKNKK
jgi:hypothetical protein